jgi:hypothetical protein
MSQSPSQIDAEIAQLESLLSSSTTWQSVDGQSASFDLKAARERLSQLQTARTLMNQGDGSFKPRNSTIDLTGV